MIGCIHRCLAVYITLGIFTFAPMDQELREKQARQTNEIYQEIGRFAVNFEHVSFAMQFGIRTLLQKSGLKNQQLANIMLADQTAYPLKTMLQVMVVEACNLDKPDLLIANKIFKRVSDLIETRNNVIHSTWFVGWSGVEDTDFSEVDGHKLSKNKGGASVKGFAYKATDFRRLSDECELVTKMLNRLCATATFGRKLSNNFVVGDDDSVHLLTNG